MMWDLSGKVNPLHSYVLSEGTFSWRIYSTLPINEYRFSLTKGPTGKSATLLVILKTPLSIYESSTFTKSFVILKMSYRKLCSVWLEMSPNKFTISWLRKIFKHSPPINLLNYFANTLPCAKCDLLMHSCKK